MAKCFEANGAEKTSQWRNLWLATNSRGFVKRKSIRQSCYVTIIYLALLQPITKVRFKCGTRNVISYENYCGFWTQIYSINTCKNNIMIYILMSKVYVSQSNFFESQSWLFYFQTFYCLPEFTWLQFLFSNYLNRNVLSSRVLLVSRHEFTNAYTLIN